MQFVVPHSCVEPTFVFDLTCARHWSVSPFAAAWLEGVPCLSVAITSTQRSALSQRLSLWQPVVHAEQHCSWTAPLSPGQGSLWCTAQIPGSVKQKQTETDGNRRKQTETHGITRNSIWRFARSGFVAVLSVKESRFRENPPKNKINNCSVPRSACLCVGWETSNSRLLELGR